MSLHLRAAPARARLEGRLAPLAAWWNTLKPRERRIVAWGAWILGLALAWAVFVMPAWHTLTDAQAGLATADADWARMQAEANEATALRAVAPVSPQEAQTALRNATDRLGSGAHLNLQGDKATVQLNGVAGPALGAWLAEVRTGGRARPVEATLKRNGQFYNGSEVLALPAAN